MIEIDFFAKWFLKMVFQFICLLVVRITIQSRLSTKNAHVERTVWSSTNTLDASSPRVPDCARGT